MLNANDEQVRGGTLCLSKAGLAIGGTKTGVAIAAPNGAGIDYCIAGKMYHKADAATVAVTAAQTVTTGYTKLFLVCLDSSGTLSTVAGTEKASASVTAGSEELQWPTPTANTCPIGGLKVTNASGSTFTTGTTNFDATNVTTNYIDMFSVPAGPETSVAS